EAPLLQRERGKVAKVDVYSRRFPQFAEFLWDQSQQRRPPTSEESLRGRASRNNWQHQSPAETKLEQAPIAEAPLSIPPAAPEESPGRQATEHVQPKIQRVVKDSAGPAAWPNVPGYTLLAELGRGGMGVVYKARHDELHRLVALKMIRANVLVDETEMGRFRAEGQGLAKMQQPKSVQILKVD